MTETGSLAALVRRIRSGDPDAAVELVREFEPFIRRAADPDARSEAASSFRPGGH